MELKNPSAPSTGGGSSKPARKTTTGSKKRKVQDEEKDEEDEEENPLAEGKKGKKVTKRATPGGDEEEEERPTIKKTRNNKAISKKDDDDSVEEEKVTQSRPRRTAPVPVKRLKDTNFKPLLAEKWDEEKGKDPTGYLISEKLDGVRAYWNGSTFLSREGNPFYAPDWFTKRMPKDVCCPLTYSWYSP